jgi:hypothetical protein
VKLFQIEEPEGGPSDPDMPGAAIGIDASGAVAEVAAAVGGNAALLTDREGFKRLLPVPAATADIASWQELFEGVRLRAERALGAPVTHAALALAIMPDEAATEGLHRAAEMAGLILLRLVDAGAGAAEPALEAAILAEELAPRPDFP